MKIRQLPVLKRVIPSARKRFAALTWPGDYKIVRRHDALFLVNFRNFVDRELAFYGDFEREQIDLLLSNIRSRGCDLFVDIGANIGLYSVIVAQAGTAVVAFEPDPRNAAQLRANIFINRLVDRITVNEVAVSETSGTVNFRLFSDTSTGQSRVSTQRNYAVRSVSLDDFMAMNGQRLFLKIDIEGHELSAVAGMQRVLVTNQCFLQIESLSPNDEKLLQLMSANGYRRLRTIGYDHFFAKVGA